MSFTILFLTFEQTCIEGRYLIIHFAHKVDGFLKYIEIYFKK